ncbi:hypothetical protein Fot_20081 [Forsythia ovata]|uniref:Uncharacterized protein n=1 Tax=Forsythia ovata TaxID=205694 RepID=A0ABD1VMW2_9LAMI
MADPQLGNWNRVSLTRSSGIGLLWTSLVPSGRGLGAAEATLQRWRDLLQKNLVPPKMERFVADEPSPKWERFESRSASPKMERLGSRDAFPKMERLAADEPCPK